MTDSQFGQLIKALENIATEIKQNGENFHSQTNAMLNEFGSMEARLDSIASSIRDYVRDRT